MMVFLSIVGNRFKKELTVVNIKAKRVTLFMISPKLPMAYSLFGLLPQRAISVYGGSFPIGYWMIGKKVT